MRVSSGCQYQFIPLNMTLKLPNESVASLIDLNLTIWSDVEILIDICRSK